MANLAINGGTPIRKEAFPSWPICDEADERRVLDVVRKRKWWMYAYGSDDLPPGEVKEIAQVEQFEQAFAKAQNIKHCLAVTSGTAALEVSLKACDVGPGDEVITTPYTFIATSSSILSQCALPVYVDIHPETYNIDPARIEEAITPKTRAILPVHFSGEIADMDPIMEIARKHKLRVIEDAAQSSGAILDDGRGAGGFGDMGTFSFQESKVMTAGEGGIVSTQDDELADATWSIRHCGRVRAGAWYEHHRIGYNFRMTEFQGAMLIGQLKRLSGQCQRRHANFKIFVEGIADLPGITPCKLHPKLKQHPLYIIMLRYDGEGWDGVHRNRVVDALEAEGIPAGFGYAFPNYANPVFKTMQEKMGPRAFAFGVERFPDWAAYREQCPVAERACDREAIWISHEAFLGTPDDARSIVDAFHKVFEHRAELRG